MVGLFIIFNKLYNLKIPKKKLIEDAAQFEIKKISNSIGKQDHYASFYEGIKFIRFKDNENVFIKKTNFLKFKKNIGSNLLFFWTGIQRSANTILKIQNKNMKINSPGLKKLRNITEEVFNK